MPERAQQHLERARRYECFAMADYSVVGSDICTVEDVSVNIGMDFYVFHRNINFKGIKFRESQRVETTKTDAIDRIFNGSTKDGFND